MSLRIERLLTKRARRTTTGHNHAGALGKRSRIRRRHPHANSVGALGVIIGQLRWLEAFDVGDGMRFDDDEVVRLVPPQGHRTNTKLLFQREIQRRVVRQLHRGLLGNNVFGGA